MSHQTGHGKVNADHTTLETGRRLISDEQLVSATGRSRQDWFDLLDEVGAASWDHATIARWLGGKHEVDGWWAQSVTVDYEHARGLRKVGERPDGRFHTSSSKTLPGTIQKIWPYIDDDDVRREWLDVEFDVRGRTPEKSLRLRASDGSKVTIYVMAGKPTVSGADRTLISVQHEGLPTAEMLEETKAFWKSALGQLAALAK